MTGLDCIALHCTALHFIGSYCSFSQGLPPGGLRRIILTASGGAFRDWDVKDLDNVRFEDAIKHPNWSMG